MKRAAVLVCLAGLAGCSTDSAHSLSRDYRNLNNEAIDALMMCTSESRAAFAKEKIFKAYTEKLGAIDKRMSTWLQNTDDKLIILDTLSCESVATLMAENPINRKRLDFEQKRIAALVAARAREGVDVRKDMPALSELAAGTNLSSLKSQLEKGNQFTDMLPKFALDKKWTSQHPKNFKELNEQFANRLKALEPVP